MANKMISLEISDELREKLRVQAFNLNVSVSKLIRMLLEGALDNETDVGK